MGPNLMRNWDDTQIAVQNAYLELVQSIVGERVMGRVPDDLIRNDYRP